MSRRNLMIVFLIAVLESSGYSQQDQIKYKPPPYTDPASGVEMYHAYCAVCHGLDGRGNGPAAPALKQKPPDLTLLSKANHSEFPSIRVSKIIQGNADITAHGSREMPMWGDVFSEQLEHDKGFVTIRVHNLTRYIASLQKE